MSPFCFWVPFPSQTIRLNHLTRISKHFSTCNYPSTIAQSYEHTHKTSTSKPSMLLLHGKLDIWVKNAKNLPNYDTPKKIWSQILYGTNHVNTTDSYVTITANAAVIGRALVIKNDENPKWNQHFDVYVAHNAAEIRFAVKDSDFIGSELIGAIAIPVKDLYYGTTVEGSFPLLNENNEPLNNAAALDISIQYTSIEKLVAASNHDIRGVGGTYFPMRKGGQVRLYQDAHVDKDFLPDLKVDGDVNYVHGNCWHDIYDAIFQAKRLVYITGWALNHCTRLVRDGDDHKYGTLGDLLKLKSQQGVKVLLLLWDDPSSTTLLGKIYGGVMQTDDEKTRHFFENSDVQVSLSSRASAKGRSWTKRQKNHMIYSHHQKTIVVDADAGNHKRQIIAFIGGLDLCKGRYDTPQHSLFRTLKSLHKDDYNNPNYSDQRRVDGSPRQPWHDLHSQIQGPAAYDILTNFEQRWSLAAKPHRMRDKHTLLDIKNIPEILKVTEIPCLSEDDPESWNVQVFRSIDSNSVEGYSNFVHGFIGKLNKSTENNLLCEKNVLTDTSIQTAYTEAIRGAQHFIYIENQYFQGSSYNWSDHNHKESDNLIPMEIALKITNKIKANERFCVYIVIPMWPEGDPADVFGQAMLLWQHKTMEMMYGEIYKALKATGLDKMHEPHDYLNFFCLGNREVQDDEISTPDYRNSSAARTPEELGRKNRRFMIYVHSKGMIVDDEYVIIGSANINQRSMKGSRDTEIAIGAYQPHHTYASKSSSPRGQVYGYRMSLWAEHIGDLEECFKHPESMECVKRVRCLSEQNWKQFAAEEISEMKGHLLKYPVEIDPTGKVNPLPDYNTFPDIGGDIIGGEMSGAKSLIKKILGHYIRRGRENITT